MPRKRKRAIRIPKDHELRPPLVREERPISAEEFTMVINRPKLWCAAWKAPETEK